ncbi:spore germination protein GerW family protein [Streptomyces sp. NPDC098781]|uniref:spore germination protein GerW family protein n=1 Tax=Streptomyces sp. NPDC098781 TaxID=3366097 RepID=UPI003825FA1F
MTPDEDHREDPTARTPDKGGTPLHAVGTLLDRLADRLGARASVTAVYGEPVTADGVTVVPVARVAFGLGGGGGRIGGAKAGEGGGGGGGVEATPVGYIEIRDGVSTYRPIRDPWSDIVVPLAALLLTGAIPEVVRAIRRRG